MLGAKILREFLLKYTTHLNKQTEHMTARKHSHRTSQTCAANILHVCDVPRSESTAVDLHQTGPLTTLS